MKYIFLIILFLNCTIYAQSGLKPQTSKKEEVEKMRSDFTPVYVKVPWIRRLDVGLSAGFPLIMQIPNLENGHIAATMMGFSAGIYTDFEFFWPYKKSLNSLGYIANERGTKRRTSFKGRPDPRFSFGLLTSLDFVHTVVSVNNLKETYQTIVVSFFLKYYIEFRYIRFLSGKIGNRMGAAIGPFFAINPVFHNVIEDTTTGFVRSGPLSTVFLLGPALQIRYMIRPDMELTFLSKTGFPLNPNPNDAKSSGGKRSLQQYFQLGIGFAL